MSTAAEVWREDQSERSKQLADVLSEYRKELVVGGFTRQEALTLVLSRQEDILCPRVSNANR